MANVLRIINLLAWIPAFAGMTWGAKSAKRKAKNYGIASRWFFSRFPGYARNDNCYVIRLTKMEVL
ncbi:MAG: hypothetical protein DRP65_04630 [Planctomycetota bacterium]|nr:MAG: hypothetical protein DRP65_04630 [Planctomycetota bacterium]